MLDTGEPQETRDKLFQPKSSGPVNDASGPNDLGQRERAVADLDGLVQRSCAGLGNREVELVLSRVPENSSGRPV